MFPIFPFCCRNTRDQTQKHLLTVDNALFETPPSTIARLPSVQTQTPTVRRLGSGAVSACDETCGPLHTCHSPFEHRGLQPPLCPHNVEGKAPRSCMLHMGRKQEMWWWLGRHLPLNRRPQLGTTAERLSPQLRAPLGQFPGRTANLTVGQPNVPLTWKARPPLCGTPWLQEWRVYSPLNSIPPCLMTTRSSQLQLGMRNAAEITDLWWKPSKQHSVPGLSACIQAKNDVDGGSPGGVVDSPAPVASPGSLLSSRTTVARPAVFCKISLQIPTPVMPA